MDDKLSAIQGNEDKKIQNEKKKFYSEPVFNEFGPMKKITLNGSLPNPDSGGGPGHIP